MLIIEVELLGGRYAATAYNDRRRAEWPPHPARFFSALAGALHDDDPVDAIEREALLWLEQQQPPSLDVDLDALGEVGRRRVLDVFVPVNDISLVGDAERPLREAREKVVSLSAVPKTPDKELKKAIEVVKKEEARLGRFIADQEVVDTEPSAKALVAAAALLPDRRTRQVRTFPVVFPTRTQFTFIWSVTIPDTLRTALDGLCARVIRLGHSSSLVRCRIVERQVTPTLVPKPDGDIVLRTVGPGQLLRLEREFERHQGVESRVLPARPQRYGRSLAERSESISRRSMFSGEWILFERVDGARPLSSRGAALSRSLRRALIERHGTKTLPPSLSGHRKDGSPADQPHLAFVTLPFVGHPHADASVQGCAIILPRGLADSEREDLLRLIAAWEQSQAVLDDGTVELASRTLPPVRFRRVELSTKVSLRPATWCRPAKRFITATPVALDRNPGNLRSNQRGSVHKASIEAQRSIAVACERIGLPRPSFVEISPAPLLSGAQPAHAFSPWPGLPGRTSRVLVHADIRFEEPISGPVLLGAGRYFGLGLCMPSPEEGQR
jgi:CRISPR-associated protein Csb2